MTTDIATEKAELEARAEAIRETIAELGDDTPAFQRRMLEAFENEIEKLAEVESDQDDAERAAEDKDRSHALHARPKAGAPARNQYGTFTVRYATPKQTAYIKALMDRKDLSAADPKKVDVEALREQVANTQVNKKAASAIIDALLELPDATTPTAPTGGRPATDKQKAFVRSLLAEREGVPAAEVVRTRLNEARVAGNLTAPYVSACIDALLEIDKAAPAPVAEVPAGRYAIPAEDGHFVFYKVDRPTAGKWEGYTFVKQLIGSVGDWEEQRLSRSMSDSVLARIAEDAEEAARMFGIKASACGMCGSPLSNTRSRAAGYGETCADNNGFFYPSEEEAREILEEREEA